MNDDWSQRSPIDSKFSRDRDEEAMMSKSQERRLAAQTEGASAEELLARIVVLEQENFLLWDVVGNLMDIKAEDMREQLARLPRRTESGDSE